MHIDLLNDIAMGEWDINGSTSQLEYQVGTKLIYVQYSKGTDSALALQKAQEHVQLAWDDMPSAIDFAERWFRAKHPAFWTVWDQATDPEHPLTVYSIHFAEGDTQPRYRIARTPEYQFECVIYDENDLWQQDSERAELPYFPDTDAVLVRRVGLHQFAWC